MNKKLSSLGLLLEKDNPINIVPVLIKIVKIIK